MDKSKLTDLVRRWGTPLYVFDEDIVSQRMQACHDIVGDGVELCYSIKANPFLIPAMSKCVGTLEVCSPGELEICRESGVSPQTILFSGVNKTAEDIMRALELGVRRFTCESPLHIRLLNEAAQSYGIILPVLLRLTAGSQFGMDEQDLRSAVENRAAYPGLSFAGIHYFAGTQQKRLSGQRKQIQRLCSLMESLRDEYGYSTECVEYGAGLYFPYFEGEDDSDTLLPLRELAPDLQALAARCRLTVEMGRFFAAPCGVYLTRAVDTKRCCGSNIAILDGGMHHVNYYGGSMGMRIPRFTQLSDATGDDTQDWMLCGSLCTTADVLVRSAPLHNLKPGDVLAFHNAGAYSVTEAPALFLSRSMPKIVLLSRGEPRLVRDAFPSWKLNCPANP